MRFLKYAMYVVLLIGMTEQCLASDLFLTRNSGRVRGRVVQRQGSRFVIRTDDGRTIGLDINDILEIRRNDIILDFQTKMRYRIETQRPLMPLAILGVAAGAFAVKSYNDYTKEKDRINNNPFPDIDMSDKSGTYMAYTIVSGLVSAGSFYFAFRPVQTRVPIGQLKLSAGPGTVTLALHF